MRSPAFALVLFGCAGGTSSSATPTSSDGWTQLRIAWDYGPCPDDGRSCHQLLTVNADGGFIASETPNAHGSGGHGEPVKRYAALDTQEVRELHRLVTPDFVARLGTFACDLSPDATIRIDVESSKGLRSQEVGACPADSPGHAVVEMLEHHRWANHDAKPTNPKPPSGQGDPCDTATGCGKGLQCIPAPCVVAPCTNGSCQKLN